MNALSPRRKRIPSENIVLPPGIGMWAVTDPNAPEGYRGDMTVRNWSIKVFWEGEARKEVEALLGPRALQALEVKRAELIEEAGADMVKRKRAEAMEYELPWREEVSRETGEPTGRIELVLKRPEFKMDRVTKQPVKNSPPLVIDAAKEAMTSRIPNNATVVVKMATWPSYFARDNKAGIKRLLETIQVVRMPTARTPDADGMETYDEGYSARDEKEGGSPEPRPSSAADY